MGLVLHSFHAFMYVCGCVCVCVCVYLLSLRLYLNQCLCIEGVCLLGLMHTDCIAAALRLLCGFVTFWLSC